MTRRYRYGIVLDAGSSGTRIHIYRWRPFDTAVAKSSRQQLDRLPQLETKKEWTLKINPGISSLADKPEEVGDYLAPLFKHMVKIIPKEDIAETPFFLLATAGLRMVDKFKREALLDHVCTYTRRNTELLLTDCAQQIQMIDGETEGLYGWIATNYLLGGFDKVKGGDKEQDTWGFLDMGGASAQMAFAPNATEVARHGKDVKLLRMTLMSGEPIEYKVFVNTWLGFGANEARKEYVKKLLEISGGDGVKELPDPCLPRGLLSTLDGKEIHDKSVLSKESYLLGTGNFEECMRQTNPVLGKDAPCHDAPCLLKDKNVPHIDFEKSHFVGISEYWHTTHDIFEMGVDQKAYDFSTYQKRVLDFCSLEWNSIEKSVDGKKWGKAIDAERAMQICFKASWLISVLHEGIGIPRVGIEGTLGKTPTPQKSFYDVFRPLDKVNGVEVSWTLGKMLLYSSAQIPSPKRASEPLPVGFGSNQAYPIPPDFQYQTLSVSANHTSVAVPEPTSQYSKHTSHFPIYFFLFAAIIALITRRATVVRRVGDFIGALSGNRRRRWDDYGESTMDVKDELDYRRNGMLSSDISGGILKSGSRERLVRSREVSPTGLRGGKYR